MAKSDDMNQETRLITEEAENVKAAIAYLLMENTEMEVDTIYSIVFHNGSKIIWH